MTPTKAKEPEPYIRMLSPNKFILDGPWTGKYKSTIFTNRASAEDALATCIIEHFNTVEVKKQ